MKKLQIKLKNNEKVYFLGDFHLGAPDKENPNTVGPPGLSKNPAAAAEPPAAFVIAAIPSSVI